MKKSNNSIHDHNMYTCIAAEAKAAALNVLAVEYLIKTNDDEKYRYYCDKLTSLSDADLEVLHIYISLNRHITTLGHMMSQGDYDSIRDNLIEFLEGGSEYCRHV